MTIHLKEYFELEARYFIYLLLLYMCISVFSKQNLQPHVFIGLDNVTKLFLCFFFQFCFENQYTKINLSIFPLIFPYIFRNC